MWYMDCKGIYYVKGNISVEDENMITVANSPAQEMNRNRKKEKEEK